MKNERESPAYNLQLSHPLSESIFPHFYKEQPLIIAHGLSVKIGDIDAREDNPVSVFARLCNWAAR